MNLLRSAHRTWALGLDGLREALMAMAERVASRVHFSKLQLRADDAETRLQQSYEALGQCLYNSRRQGSHDASSVDAVLPLTARIRHEQQLLQELHDRLASHYDELLSIPLARLQEDLKEGGGTVERVTISPGAQADGKSLSELALPMTVRLVALRRGQTLLIPSGSLTLQAGDDLTVLGSRSTLPQALHILRI
jgi:K+/H+ antiporter YhaU regulatory subunit KhtT